MTSVDIATYVAAVASVLAVLQGLPRERCNRVGCKRPGLRYLMRSRTLVTRTSEERRYWHLRCARKDMRAKVAG